MEDLWSWSNVGNYPASQTDCASCARICPDRDKCIGPTRTRAIITWERREEESRAEGREGERAHPSISHPPPPPLSHSLVAHRISSCKMTRRNEYMSHWEQGARPRGRDDTAKAWLSISKAIMKTDKTLDLAFLRDFPIFLELFYHNVGCGCRSIRTRWSYPDSPYIGGEIRNWRMFWEPPHFGLLRNCRA